MFLVDKRHPVSTAAAWTCSTIDALFSAHQHPVLKLLQKVHVDIYFAALHRPEELFEKMASPLQCDFSACSYCEHKALWFEKRILIADDS